MRLLCDENLWGARTLLDGLGELVLRPGRSIGPADVASADALLLRSQTRIDAALLAGARPSFVGTATAGYEHVDTALLAELGIPFASAPGSNAEPVADWVTSVLAGCAVDGLLDLEGARCAVIGCGEVGGRVARRLTALGCGVLCVDPPRVRRGQTLPGRPGTLAEALACDVVTVHTPLTDTGPYATRDLLCAEAIDALRPGAILLNAARGGVVDDAALCGRLRSAADLHVALDVYADEPVPDRELLARCRVATPHVAGHSVDGKMRGTLMIRDAFCAALGTVPRTTAADALPELPPVEEVASSRTAALAFAADARDLVADSRAFRAALEDERSPGEAFDELRRHYAPHRDFATRRVRSAGPSARLLAAMGFAVEEVGA